MKIYRYRNFNIMNALNTINPFVGGKTNYQKIMENPEKYSKGGINPDAPTDFKSTMQWMKDSWADSKNNSLLNQITGKADPEEINLGSVKPHQGQTTTTQDSLKDNKYGNDDWSHVNNNNNRPSNYIQK